MSVIDCSSLLFADIKLYHKIYTEEDIADIQKRFTDLMDSSIETVGILEILKLLVHCIIHLICQNWSIPR